MGFFEDEARDTLMRQAIANGFEIVKYKYCELHNMPINIKYCNHCQQCR